MIENENELVERASAGDYGAFDTLVGLYEDRIYNLAIKMLTNEEDAHEIVQETFLSAYKNLEKFRGDASFYTWINRIAVNNCFQKLRGRIKSKGDISLDEVHPFPGGKPPGAKIESWDFTPEKMTIQSELAVLMKEALLELPENYRVVFILKDVDGHTNEEIAEILELTIPAVKSRLNRARLFLRKRLAPYFSGEKGMEQVL